jgi:hypothetical protein
MWQKCGNGHGPKSSMNQLSVAIRRSSGLATLLPVPSLNFTEGHPDSPHFFKHIEAPS